ncbi:hypothetical protein HNQ69_000801 [Bartonella callosciuri]|uniref:Uncharacterized protein n=1 Tax=Bartonella callosciuri TaxID=686223 RepID=A0A840NUR5_9HYPH|nr:hypothetical protein [Bartonella callosciuri]
MNYLYKNVLYLFSASLCFRKIEDIKIVCKDVNVGKTLKV